MTKTIVQPAGYAITVTSWENDGDHYNTKTLTVSSREEAQVLYALATLLRSQRHGQHCFGNMYEPNEYHLQQFSNAVAAIPGMKEFLHNICPELESQDPEYGADYMDVVMDVLYDLGLCGGENFFTRVCEKVDVHYYAEPVYADDVTAEFM
jgi:hypothetical protein